MTGSGLLWERRSHPDTRTDVVDLEGFQKPRVTSGQSVSAGIEMQRIVGLRGYVRFASNPRLRPVIMDDEEML